MQEASINQERDEVAEEMRELAHVVLAAKEALGDKELEIENAVKQVEVSGNAPRTCHALTPRAST